MPKEDDEFYQLDMTYTGLECYKRVFVTPKPHGEGQPKK
jgi:hypothetical protein